MYVIEAPTPSLIFYSINALYDNMMEWKPDFIPHRKILLESPAPLLVNLARLYVCTYKSENKPPSKTMAQPRKYNKPVCVNSVLTQSGVPQWSKLPRYIHKIRPVCAQASIHRRMRRRRTCRGCGGRGAKRMAWRARGVLCGWFLRGLHCRGDI